MRTGARPVMVRQERRCPRAEPVAAGGAHDCPHLDQALAEMVGLCVAEVNVARMLRRLGWDGQGGCSVRAVAMEAGVTPERVRQVEAALLRRLRCQTPVPALERAVDILQRAVAERGQADGTDLLLEAGLTTVPFMPRGVLRAAEIFGVRTVGFSIAEDGRTIRRTLPAELSAALLEALVELAPPLHHIVSLEELRRAVRDRGHRADEQQVRLFLDRRQRLAWLDEARTWFWIRQPQGRSPVERAIRKVLSVCPAIDLRALAEALARSARVWPRPLPHPCLAGLCRAAGLHVRDDVVSSGEPIDPAAVLSPSELLLVQQLLASGGTMALRELRTATGLAHATLRRLQASSPIVTIARDTARLCGR